MTDTAPKDGTPSTEVTKETTVEGKSPGTETTKNPNDFSPSEDNSWWEEAKKESGFKTPSAVYESWKNSTKKINDQETKLREAEKFQTDVAPVLVALNEDPELRDRLIAKLSGKSPGTQKDTQPTEDKETRGFLEGQVVSSFEEKHGINKLDEETQKDLRKEIGKYLSPSGKLGTLSDEMENALIIAMAKNEKVKNALSNKEKTESPLTDYGALSSMGSSILPNGEVHLTPAQEKVASNMPGGRETYIEGLKKISGVKP